MSPRRGTGLLQAVGPEPTSDSAPSAKQIVFLFMAATVVAVVVFLCGVLVGRGVPLGGGLTVSGSAVEGLTMDDLPPPTLSTPSAEPSAAASESADLTYYRRLNEDEPSPETLRPESSAAADPIDATDRVDSTSDGNDDGGVSPSSAASASGSSAGRDGLTTAGAAAPLEPASPASGTTAPSTDAFSVQVAAMRSQESAQQVVSQLVAKGYPAAVVSPEPGAPVALFRVRVGPYADRAEAERIRSRLETEEQFDPFVTR